MSSDDEAGCAGDYARTLRYFSKVASIVAVAIGVAVLFGWALDIPFLRTVMPGQDSTKPNTALLFILAGSALWLLNSGTERKFFHRAAQLLGISILSLAVLTLVEYMTGVNLCIDEMLFLDVGPVMGTHPPGRMAMTVALLFTMVGVGITAHRVSKALVYIQMMMVTGLMLALFSLFGYFYGVKAFYDLSSYTQMAIPTMLGAIILTMGFLGWRPSEGIMEIVTSDTIGGETLRMLLPAAVIIPLVLGLLRLEGERAGLFEVEFGVALMVFTLVAVLFVIIWRVASSLHKADVQRRLLEAQLRVAKEAAEDATKAKSKFLAHMSHEIRTPMSNIIGMIEIAMDSNLSKEQSEHLALARDAAKSLMQILNDILDISKVEARKLDFEKIPFNLTDTIGDLMSLHRIEAGAKGLELNYDVCGDVPRTVLGDPLRLGQVLSNLLKNAIKFTEKGGVLVKLSASPPKQDGKVELLFEVSDTGIGMSKETLDKIFEEFRQGDDTITRKYGGTGLGLSIARELVGLMGGRIWAESEMGKGSTFHFNVVLSRGGNDGDMPLGDPVKCNVIPHGLKILIVDDNTLNRKFAKHLLDKLRAVPDTAANGREAIEAMSKTAYDLVLMDIQMPEMDGVEATRKIRASESGLQHVPVIALSAHTMKEDVDTFVGEGFDGYLPKPIDLDALCREISKVLPPQRMLRLGDFRARVGGDEGLVRQLLQIYIEDVGAVMEGIERAIQAEDPKALVESAHELKGMSANVSAEVARELSLELEMAGREGKFNDVHGTYAKLKEKVEETVKEINAFLDLSKPEK